MKHFILGIALFSMIFNPLVFAAEPTEQIATYRSAIKELGTQLKTELMQAIKSSNLVEAINVCHSRADEIAASVSEKQGFVISRVSFKYRNPKNAPEAWEQTVLEQFEQRKDAGENLKSLEFHEVVQIDGQKVSRYMKAIPTRGKCLSCHGSEIEPEIQDKIKQLYPEDKAINLEAGDIRGAFSITEILP